MLLNRNFQRLGDLAAGTLVVYRNEAADRIEMPRVAALQPPRNLSREERRTLLTFAERSPLLTAERRIELAEILAPVTDARGEQAVTRLHAYASWLAQGR